LELGKFIQSNCLNTISKFQTHSYRRNVIECLWVITDPIIIFNPYFQLLGTLIDEIS